MTDKVNLTAKGSGYFVVYVNEAKVSQHTTEREAIEEATNRELAKPADKVEYRHEYSVSVDAPDAPVVEPPPPVVPPTPPSPLPPPPPPPPSPPPVPSGPLPVLSSANWEARKTAAAPVIVARVLDYPVSVTNGTFGPDGVLEAYIPGASYGHQQTQKVAPQVLAVNGGTVHPHVVHDPVVHGIRYDTPPYAQDDPAGDLWINWDGVPNGRITAGKRAFFQWRWMVNETWHKTEFHRHGANPHAISLKQAIFCPGRQGDGRLGESVNRNNIVITQRPGGKNMWGSYGGSQTGYMTSGGLSNYTYQRAPDCVSCNTTAEASVPATPWSREPFADCIGFEPGVPYTMTMEVDLRGEYRASYEREGQTWGDVCFGTIRWWQQKDGEPRRLINEYSPEAVGPNYWPLLMHGNGIAAVMFGNYATGHYNDPDVGHVENMYPNPDSVASMWWGEFIVSENDPGETTEIATPVVAPPPPPPIPDIIVSPPVDPPPVDPAPLPTGRPQWVLDTPVNTVIDVGTNVMNDIPQVAADNGQWPMAWVGAALVRDHGTLGAVSVRGGGHSGGVWAGPALFEVDDLTWRGYEPRRNLNEDMQPDGDGFYRTDAAGNPIPPTPPGVHSYADTHQLRAIHGGGPKGSTISLAQQAATNFANGYPWAARYDHDTKVWSPYSLNQYQRTLGGAVYFGQDFGCEDHIRGGHWLVYAATGSNHLQYLDPITRLWTVNWVGDVGLLATGYTIGGEPQIGHCKSLDIIILRNFNGDIVWANADQPHANGGWKMAIQVNKPTDLPNQSQAPMWCDRMGAFSILGGASTSTAAFTMAQHIDLVTPSLVGGVLTLTWSRKQITGGIRWPVGGAPAEVYNRCPWHDDLGGWFWWANQFSKMQFIRGV